MQKPLSIDIIANDGSPLGVVYRDIYGENGRLGLGGAELALMTMCEAWHNAGHRVRLFNNPKPASQHGSPFKQLSLESFSPYEDRDVLIVFRSPNRRVKNARGKIVWWSTDQYTVGSFSDFSKMVDEIVTISGFHANHFSNAYNIQNTHTIDLAVRTQDYEQVVEKVPNRLIFCSVPDRGLDILADCYSQIREEVPDTSLVVTSDYRLWGADSARNERFIQRFLGVGGVKFLGAIPRRDMVVEQMKAQIQAYPCSYDELFCYAVAECQVAGTLPITSNAGALETTNMGITISGSPRDRVWKQVFVDMVTKHLKSQNLPEMQKAVQTKAVERFSLKNIMKQWDSVLYD